jgi:hypothetical protein
VDRERDVIYEWVDGKAAIIISHWMNTKQKWQCRGSGGGAATG